MFVYCIQTVEDIVKLLSRIGSLIIPAFSLRAPISNSKGDPFIGGVKYTGGGGICDFRLISPFILETVRDRSIVAVELQWNVIGGGSIRVSSDDLQ